MELIQKYISPLRLPFGKELTGIFLAVLIFLIFPFMIRQIDSSAAAIDAGILSAIILAVIAMLIFKALTWWLLRTIWPVFADFSTYHFERNFKLLERQQKVLIYLGFYLLILYGFIAVLGVLL